VIAALVRGDYDLNEAKLLRELGAAWIELADEETVVKTTGAPSGFAGPVGLKCTILADFSVKGIVNGVTGANDADAHLINVNPNRDFTIKSFSDLRVVVDGDDCPRCDGNLSIRRGIEVGHVFKLGTKYSNSMGATFLDEEGKQQPMIMGCYGIGIGRTVAACIEQNHDENGIAWPLPMAPFQVTILPLTAREKEVTEEAEKLYREITALGVDVLLDDRDERAGVKFNDAELLGTPIRIVIGKKGLKEGVVEIKGRTEQEAQLVPLEGVIDEVRGRLSPA
jgi:prolyl-tRNA synthetase